jgi:hypothetical protein
VKEQYSGREEEIDKGRNKRVTGDRKGDSCDRTGDWQETGERRMREQEAGM